MIETLPAPSNVAAFRVSGNVTGADYDRCIADIESHLRQHERIGLLVDLTGLDRIEPDAMGKDLRYGVEKLGEYGRFARSAVVTGRDWQEKSARMADTLLPNSEVRSFDPAERAAALSWVSELPPEPRSH